MNKHLIWALAIVSIFVIMCGTLVWLNHNAWTLRFEMDNNTKEAIGFIEWQYVNGNCVDKDYWYNNGDGRTWEDVDYDKLNNTINCLNNKLLKQSQEQNNEA